MDLEPIVEEYRPDEVVEGPDEGGGAREEEYAAREVARQDLARRDGEPDEGRAHHRDEGGHGGEGGDHEDALDPEDRAEDRA